MAIAYRELQFDSLAKSVIRNKARSHGRKYRRWGRELLILDTADEFGQAMSETVLSPWAEEAFLEGEVKMLICTLPPVDRDVLYRLIILGRSEMDVAKSLHMSQSHVSRIKIHAIEALRRELTGG